MTLRSHAVPPVYACAIGLSAPPAVSRAMAALLGSLEPEPDPTRPDGQGRFWVLDSLTAKQTAKHFPPRRGNPSKLGTSRAFLAVSLGGKWLELLSEIAPGLKRAAIIFNPDFPVASQS